MAKWNIGARTPLSPREKLINRYRNARSTLLGVMLFSAINVVMAAFGSDTYFLFSATIPYFIAMLGAILCGRMSDEFYAYLELGEMDFLPGWLMIGFAVIALVLVAAYFVLWLLSKHRVGWLIAALVFFALDTVLMFVLFGFVGMILDIVFHIWVLVSLILGVVAYKQLQNMPPEEVYVQPQV